MTKIFLLLLVGMLSLFASSTQKVSIQLQWLDQFQFAGYYMAKEKGYYKDVGLELEIKKFDFGVDVVSEVTEGRASYGIGRTSLISNKSNGADIRLLFATFQSSPLVIIAREDSGINNIEDFRAKKLMTTDDLSTDLSLYGMQKRFGISVKDLDSMEHTFDVGDLISGKTDLMVGYISNEPFLMETKGVKAKIFDPKEYGYDLYSDLVFSLSSSDENRDKKFRSASIKGWKYAFDNIQESVELILKHYNPQNKSKDALIYEAQALKKLAYYQNAKMGEIKIREVERIYDIYNIVGLASESIDMQSFILSNEKQELNSEYTKEEQEWLAANPMIEIAIMNYWDQDKYRENRHTEIIKMLNKYGNLHISLAGYESWSEGYLDSANGAIHGILNLSWNKERADNIFFYTQTYALDPNYLLVRDDEMIIKKLQDLNDKVVYTQKDSITKNVLHDVSPDARIIYSDTDIQIYKKLEEQREGIAAITSLLDEKLLKKHHLKVVQTIYDKYAQLAIGVNQKYPLLHSILNKAFSKIPKDKMTEYEDKKYDIVESEDRIAFTKEESDWLKTHKKLNILIDREWQPFIMYSKEKDIHGIAIDYMEQFSTSSGIKFNFVKADSKEQIQKLIDAKEIDITPCIKKTPHSLESFNITDPYISFPVVAVTKDDISLVTKMSDIQKKKFALVKDISSTEMIKQKYPYLDFVEFDSETSALEAVSNSQADVFISNMATVSYLLKRLPYSNLKIAGQVELKGEWGIGFRKDIDPVAISVFNKVIKNMAQSEKEIILDRWMSLTLDAQVDYTIVYQLLSVFILFLLGGFYWNTKLSASKREAEDAKNFSSGIMNSQKDIIITIDTDGNMQDANTSFLKFFEVESMEQFRSRYGECICETFVEGISKNYITKEIDGTLYYKYMQENPDKYYKVAMLQDETTYIFSITLNSFSYLDEEVLTLVFTDITELEKLSREKGELLKHTLESIEYASHIQNALIPDDALFDEYFDETAIVWEPKDTVGGDIYLFTELNRGQQESILMVIDCTGHGVSGAFVTMLVRAIERQITAKLNSNRYKEVSPAWILSYFNKSMKVLLRQESKGSKSNAGFDGQIIYYNKDTNILKCASARNEIFYLKNRELTTIKPDRHSVGYTDSNRDYVFKDTVIDIDRELTFYIASDGLWDQCGGAKDLSYGKKRFKAQILEHQEQPLQAQKALFLKSLNEYQADNDRNDDVTLLVVKVSPKETIQEIVTMLKHHGAMNQEVISYSIDILEDKILNTNIVKLVSMVFVELCQNIIRHSKVTEDSELESFVEVEKYADDEFSVFARYDIANDDKVRLEVILDELNFKDLIAIKAGFKTIRDAEDTEQNRELLKFYEIAKIAQSIDYEFIIKNSSVYTFKFKAMVSSMYKRSSDTWAKDNSLLSEIAASSEVLLSYSTTLSQAVLNEIIAELNQELNKIEGGHKLLNKISYVVIEQVQNILSYSADTEVDNENIYTSDGVVMVGYSKDKESYFVATSNTIKEKDILKLSRKIEYINSLSNREKKDYYKKLLFSGDNKHSRGAGIGLISIARKSSQELEFRITTTESGLTFQLLTYI